MFAKLATLSTLAILAAATPTPNEPASSCSTGPIQCCESTTTAEDPAAAGILAGLGIVVQDVNALVGLQCSAVTGVGVGGGTCTANAVCCQDNSHSNLISIGCVPVTL